MYIYRDDHEVQAVTVFFVHRNWRLNKQHNTVYQKLVELLLDALTENIYVISCSCGNGNRYWVHGYM